MISCNTSQCKRKKWCKRHQLYLQNAKNTGVRQDFSLNFKQMQQRRSISINMYKYFIPTEQYQIKEKLEKLSNL